MRRPSSRCIRKAQLLNAARGPCHAEPLGVPTQDRDPPGFAGQKLSCAEQNVGRRAPRWRWGSSYKAVAVICVKNNCDLNWETSRGLQGKSPIRGTFKDRELVRIKDEKPQVKKKALVKDRFKKEKVPS